MKAMRRTILALGVTGLLFVAGCQTKGPQFNPRETSAVRLTNMTEVSISNQFDPAWLKVPTNLFTLGPGDAIDVEILGAEAYRQPVVVGPDGKVYFYLLPGVDVWGLTLEETKAVLERELSTFVKETGQVSISLLSVQSKRVWALGRLGAPGLYSMSTPMTLLELLSRAGGIVATGTTGSVESLADLRHSFLIRHGRLMPVDFYQLMHEGNISQNIYLQADDFVFVPSSSAREVYVLGAVVQPRPVPCTDMITLLGAIATAGGPIPGAYQSHVAIVRGSLSKPRIAVVNYRDILRGKATDVLLEPRDIVFVPVSPWSFLDRYATYAVETFVRTVAANAGARTIDASAKPVSPSVPLN
jgi:protein involved in polysaccharide export with SLBB domain